MVYSYSNEMKLKMEDLIKEEKTRPALVEGGCQVGHGLPTITVKLSRELWLLYSSTVRVAIKLQM